ncbi:ribose-phosphate pyrophosphokinase [Candidatus Woesearchaeota archaeon]|nr:ribose-phosphate pyrophosphokinase [Candidatus Woesearchaeota archaeon]
MLLYYTQASKHLADQIKIRKGNFIIKKFSDGEVYVRILDHAKNKKVWVLASTQAPAEHLLELLFLLDALHREKAEISLLIPYFGYARQDRIVEPGECLSAEVVSSFIKKNKIKKIVVVHAHSALLKKFLNFEDCIPYPCYFSLAKKYDVIVAPDYGAFKVAQKLAKFVGKKVAWLEKHRPKQERVVTSKIHGKVRGKKVLIFDDLSVTGGTLLAANHVLKKHGAVHVDVLVTHGLFTPEALQKLKKEKIEVYTTNTLYSSLDSMHVINIAEHLEKIMKEKHV